MARKRYQSNRFSNPFFKQKKHVPWKPILIGVAVLVGIVGITGFSLGHKNLNIKHVEILGVEHISTLQLESSILDYLNSGAFAFFSRANIFLFRTADLETQLGEMFTFSSITVSTQGTTLFISIKERTSNLVWQTGDAEYIVDLTGTVVRRREGEEGLDLELPLFIDKNALAVSIGETVLTEKEVNGTLLFHEHLSAQGILFYDTTFDRLAGKWVSVTTVDGYSILFDPTGDVDAQASRLQTVLQTQVDDVTALDYIDLRFGDHIYFR